MTCANGYRVSDYTSYLSDWGVAIPGGDTIDNRDLCWSKAQEAVPGAVGIYWDFVGKYCRAIDNLDALGTMQTTYPNFQDRVKLCLWNPGIQSLDL